MYVYHSHAVICLLPSVRKCNLWARSVTSVLRSVCGSFAENRGDYDCWVECVIVLCYVGQHVSAWYAYYHYCYYYYYYYYYIYRCIHTYIHTYMYIYVYTCICVYHILYCSMFVYDVRCCIHVLYTCVYMHLLLFNSFWICLVCLFIWYWNITFVVHL